MVLGRSPARSPLSSKSLPSEGLSRIMKFHSPSLLVQLGQVRLQLLDNKGNGRPIRIHQSRRRRRRPLNFTSLTEITLVACDDDSTFRVCVDARKVNNVNCKRYFKYKYRAITMPINSTDRTINVKKLRANSDDDNFRC